MQAPGGTSRSAVEASLRRSQSSHSTLTPVFMTDPELLKILCCPETRQPLMPADAVLVQQLNAQIDSGLLRNRAGQTVSRKCDGGLIRQDGRFLYPICQHIPILLINEAIPLGGEVRAPAPASAR